MVLQVKRQSLPSAPVILASLSLYVHLILWMLINCNGSILAATYDADSSSNPSNGNGCNRTLHGEIGFKYPLRLTEPLQRFLPFVCEITFSAVGGRSGDIIELTFLSFQVGSLEITKDQTASCQKGYLALREPRQLQSMSDFPGSNVNGSSEGRFCGQMMVRKAIYFSQGSNLTLSVSLPPGRAFYGHSLPFSLFLTYRFLAGRNAFAHMSSSSPDLLTDFGMKLGDSYCDRVFEDCLPPRRCRIRSPHYPGFFPRNLTCHFLIRQNKVPRGYRPRITISQSNEYKISIYSGSSPGSTGTMAKANRGLQSDCQTDVIRIHDGPELSSPKLAELCGSGHLPAVVSSQPQLLVTLYSAPNLVMYDSRVELSIEVALVRVEPNETSFAKSGLCDQQFQADRIRSGIFATPTHTVPHNASCTYTFASSRAEDRVWVYFASYYAQDFNHWNSEEKCDSSKLEIYGARLEARNDSSSAVGDTSAGDLSTASSREDDEPLRYCEKSSPRVCGRASDAADYLPSISCTYPEESYLSTGPQLTIKQFHYKPSNLYSAGSAFRARFEFVDTQESGEAIENTSCDRLFDSAVSSRGEVRSTHNVFNFGRGGRRDMSCAYKFVSRKHERLRLHITSYRLNSTDCRHAMDTSSGIYSCRASRHVPGARLATLMVLDTIKSEEINVGCFCSGEKRSAGREKAITFDLIGSEVILNLTMAGMLATDDFTQFGFEAKYEFLSGGECQAHGLVQKKDGREGEILYSVPSSQRFSDQPKEVLTRCRWLVEGSRGKHLYLKFKGFMPKEPDECANKNRYVIYSGNPWRPMATVCAHQNGNQASGRQRDEDVDLFSQSWYNKTEIAPYLPASPAEPAVKFGANSRTRLIVEIVAHGQASFALKWLEVTKPFSGESLKNTDCLYKCPELNACISPDLWCDGTAHCPSGFDESSSHCAAFPLLWVLLASGLAFITVTLVVVAAHCTWRGKKGAKNSTEERVEKDPPVHYGHNTAQCSFRSTYYQAASPGVIYSRSHESSGEDFLPSERDFDFRGFREMDERQEHQLASDPEAINETTTTTSTYSTGTGSTLTRTSLVSPYSGYNPYERPSYVSYYHRNVF